MGTTFSAYDIRGRAGDNISVEYAWAVGKAFSEWVSDEGLIVVGTVGQADSSIARGFVEGVLLQGRDVIGVGAGDANEQAIRVMIADKRAAGAALISHDGIQGIEIIALYDANGAPIRSENGLVAINELAESDNFLPAATKGTILSV